MLTDNRFEKDLCKHSYQVTIFLISGVKLNGSISLVVNGAIFLTRDGVHQKIFSHAIATILPQDAQVLDDLLAIHQDNRATPRGE